MNDAHASQDVLAARLDALTAQVAYLVERQKKQEELFAEMTPILKEVMATATTRLDELEKKGYFAFGKEALAVGARVVESYSADDVRKLGDAIVGILDTVRAFTQPEVLSIAEQAGTVLQKADQAEPVGNLGVVRASRSDDVQKGMAVLLDVLRHVGRAAQVIADQRRSSEPRGERPRAAAPAAPRRILGVERPAPRRPAPAAPRDMPPPAACAVPRASKGPVAVLDGVGFSADGHLADPSAWTPELAQRLADAHAVPLTDAHWKLIQFARADFEKTGVSPNVRRVTQGTGVSTKDLYSLFPKAPARTLAKIAGIPKPAGCI